MAIPIFRVILFKVIYEMSFTFWAFFSAYHFLCGNLDNSAELSPNGNLTPFVATKVAYGKVGSKPIALNVYNFAKCRRHLGESQRTAKLLFCVCRNTKNPDFCLVSLILFHLQYDSNLVLLVLSR